MEQSEYPVNEAWLYHHLGAASSDAIMFSDIEGKIRLWNRGAELIFGFTPEVALGASLDIIIPENLRKRHWDGYHEVMGGRPTIYGARLLTVPALHKDGSRISVEFSIVMVTDESGAPLGVGAILRDVTARWEKERELKARVGELERQVDR